MRKTFIMYMQKTFIPYMYKTLIPYAAHLKQPRILALCTGALILLVFAFTLLAGPDSTDRLRWAASKRGEFIVELVESGEIRSTFSYDMKTPMIWGNLQIMEMVPEGTIVKPGDVIARFDPSGLKNELDNIRESLERSEAELKALDTEQKIRYSEMETNIKTTLLSRELAELRRERMKFESPLQQRQAELEYQKQMLMFDEEETRLKNQKIIDNASRMRVLMSYEQSRNWVENLERRISDLTLRAPIGGLVVYNEIGGHGTPRHKVALGDKPWPSQPIMSIPDPEHMEAVMRVNEVDAGKITIGDKAALTLDAFEQTAYTGTVTRVSRLADKRSSGSQIKDFEVVIAIANPDSMLKPGMTAQGKIVLNRLQNMMYVPIGAVFEKQDGNPVVFKKKNHQKPVPVILGKRNDRFVIIADGVWSGDEISLTPPAGKYFPLGRAREMERREKELAMLKATPDSAFTPESRVLETGAESRPTAAQSPGKPAPAPAGGAPVRSEMK